MEINMFNSGEIRVCKGMNVFRVDHKAIPAGALLRMHHMHRHSRLIEQLQSFIEAGYSSLARHLSDTEWKRLNLSERTIGLESDVVKMMVVLEAIFEHTRKMMAPNLPCRLDCIFTWPTLEIAREFRETYIPEGVIHRCRITEGEAVMLDGGQLPPGISLSDLSPGVFSAEFRDTQSRAEKYWLAQEPPILSELLVMGSVKVVGVEVEAPI
jgi:hypothetical protein